MCKHLHIYNVHIKLIMKQFYNSFNVQVYIMERKTIPRQTDECSLLNGYKNTLGIHQI